MKQTTLAMAADQGAGFERYRKTTRREVFLAQMQTLVPWAELGALIEPHYPKAGNGRPPIGLQRMLRIHLLQHWFNLADEAMEEALYDSASLRAFVGIDLGREPVPDATSLLRFRHLLEQHRLGEALFAEVGRLLQDKGLKLSGGTIVDATLIAAPSSTKNAERARDAEMKQTKKGQQWHFGMKVHVGADAKTGVVHAAVVTAANVHDKHAVPDLLHGEETRVPGLHRPDQAGRPQGQGLHQPAGASALGRGRGGAGEEPDQEPHPGASGARVPCAQAAVRLCQGALPGAGEERQPGVHGAGAGESGHGATTHARIGASVAVEMTAAQRRSGAPKPLSALSCPHFS
jgi:IS5 family transposase